MSTELKLALGTTVVALAIIVFLGLVAVLH